MHSIIGILLCAIVYKVIAQTSNQGYTSIESTLTPSKNNICYFDVSETITLQFIDPKKPLFITRFIPDDITSSVASVSDITITSLTNGVMVQDVGASGYDVTQKGFLIKQIIYNPNREYSATFQLQYTVNCLTPTTTTMDTVHWYFEQSPFTVSKRRLSIVFPSYLLPASTTSNDITFGQVPIPATDQYTMQSTLPSPYIEQENVNWAGYITLSFPSPYSTQCNDVNVNVAPNAPPTGVIIGAVLGSIFGALILFGIGVLCCVGVCWFTHTDYKFRRLHFAPLYDENQ
jgi:hypothetical protein